MFGYLRLFLAFLVLISHTAVRFEGMNPGVSAVVVFYILAGYVVSHLYTQVIPDGSYKVLRFYQNRIIRIFPLYLYVAGLTVLFLLTTSFGSPRFTVFNIFANLTVIPLNYYMAADSTVLSDPSWCLIPPAWSLGTELQAYLLLPLALVLPRFGLALAAVSFGVYVTANLSLIHPDYFGYRLLPGVFFIFLIGSAIQKSSDASKAGRFDHLFPWVVWGAVALLAVLFYLTGSFSPTYTRETFIGLLVGIPLVYLFSRSRLRLPFNNFLGSLSYGIFLTHFLAMWILEHYAGMMQSQSWMYIFLVTMISVAVSSLGVVVIEKRFFPIPSGR